PARMSLGSDPSGASATAEASAGAAAGRAEPAGSVTDPAKPGAAADSTAGQEAREPTTPSANGQRTQESAARSANGKVAIAPPAPRPATGPIDWVMSTVIRKLSWSRLSEPKIAISLSAAGLLLGMLVGATATNAETLPIRLPLSSLLPSLHSQ